MEGMTTGPDGFRPSPSDRLHTTYQLLNDYLASGDRHDDFERALLDSAMRKKLPARQAIDLIEALLRRLRS